CMYFYFNDLHVSFIIAKRHWLGQSFEPQFLVLLSESDVTRASTSNTRFLHITGTSRYQKRTSFLPGVRPPDRAGQKRPPRQKAPVQRQLSDGLAKACSCRKRHYD